MDTIPSDMSWHLKKIPKQIFLYWGKNQTLSFMRFMTAYSLSVLNKDWKIQVYYPIKTSHSVTWASASHKHVKYKGKDYFNDLKMLPNVEVREFSFNTIRFKENCPEVYKSDVLRLHLLSKFGGIWSDFDIIYFKPLEQMNINRPENAAMDTGVCYLMDNHPLPQNRIGFLMASKENKFFADLLYHALRNVDTRNYQSYGASIYNRFTGFKQDNLGKIFQQKGKNICNISMNTVYPLMRTGGDHLQKLYLKKENILKEDTIGIHWYGGGKLSGDYEQKVSPVNMDSFNESVVLKKMSSIYKHDRYKYSIIMPYIKRSVQLYDTLLSYVHHYTECNRNDFEVVIVEDNKNVRDHEEHKKLMTLIDVFRKRGININCVEDKSNSFHSPSVLFNAGVRASQGEIIVLTSPECFHNMNILLGLDKEFIDKYPIYVVCSCACTNRGYKLHLRPKFSLEYKIFMWYQHSVHRNKRYHFCSALYKKDYERIGGLDEVYAQGISYDDDDFIKKVKTNGLDIRTRDDLPVVHLHHDKISTVYPNHHELVERNRKIYMSKWKESIA